MMLLFPGQTTTLNYLLLSSSYNTSYVFDFLFRIFSHFFFHKSCHLNLGPFYDHHDFNRHHVGKNENQGKFSFSFYPSDIYLIKFKHTSSNLKSTSTGGSLPSGRKGIKINIVICFFEGSYVK